MSSRIAGCTFLLVPEFQAAVWSVHVYVVSPWQTAVSIFHKMAPVWLHTLPWPAIHVQPAVSILPIFAQTHAVRGVTLRA